MLKFRDYLKDQTILIEEAIQFQKETNSSIIECTFRHGTRLWCEYWKLLKEKSELQDGLDDFEKEILTTDIGLKALYEDYEVQLDYPYINEKYEDVEDVELNSPKRGGSKKFYVYVKNDKGNVIKVQFGDTSGLKAKINNPEARASFAARHQCHLKNDKTTPGYWSCRLPKYAKQLGLEGGGKFFW